MPYTILQRQWDIVSTKFRGLKFWSLYPNNMVFIHRNGLDIFMLTKTYKAKQLGLILN